MPRRPRYCEINHQGYRPMHVRMLGVSLRPFRIEHLRFRFCTHPQHADHMAGFPDRPAYKPTKGRAITIIRVGRRWSIIKTPYLDINRQIRRQVADAMRQTAQTPHGGDTTQILTVNSHEYRLIERSSNAEGVYWRLTSIRPTFETPHREVQQRFRNIMFHPDWDENGDCLLEAVIRPTADGCTIRIPPEEATRQSDNIAVREERKCDTMRYAVLKAAHRWDRMYAEALLAATSRAEHLDEIARKKAESEQTLREQAQALNHADL